LDAEEDRQQLAASSGRSLREIAPEILKTRRNSSGGLFVASRHDKKKEVGYDKKKEGGYDKKEADELVGEDAEEENSEEDL